MVGFMLRIKSRESLFGVTRKLGGSCPPTFLMRSARQRQASPLLTQHGAFPCFTSIWLLIKTMAQDCDSDHSLQDVG